MKTAHLNCSSKRILLAVAISNSISTAIGIPLAWGIMFSVQLIITGGGGSFSGISDFWNYFLGATLQAPYLLPYDSEMYWMLPTAFIVLLVPFFVASYWIESWVNFFLVRKFDNTFSQVKKGTWKANIYSYAFLLIPSILYLIYQIGAHRVFLSTYK